MPIIGNDGKIIFDTPKETPGVPPKPTCGMCGCNLETEEEQSAGYCDDCETCNPFMGM